MKRETITPPGAVTYQSPPSSSHSERQSNFADLSPPSSVSASPLRKLSNSTTSDVDFSPSTGWFELPSKLHPVPTSLDNGITLDWTGGSSHEERRWTKSIVKKRDKDSLPPLGVMIDEQEEMHKGVMEMPSNRSFALTSSRKADKNQQFSVSADQPKSTYNERTVRPTIQSNL